MTKTVDSLGPSSGAIPPSGHSYDCTYDWERYKRYKCVITIISCVAGAGLIGLGLYNYFWRMKASDVVVLPITLGGIGMIPSLYSFGKWWHQEGKAKAYAQKGADIIREVRHDPTTLDGACKVLKISSEEIGDRRTVEYRKFDLLKRYEKLLTGKVESPLTAAIKLLKEDACRAYETIKRNNGWGTWEDSPEFEDFTKDSGAKKSEIAKVD